MISYKLKPKTGLWSLLPFNSSTAQTIFPYIFVPKKVFVNLNSVEPDLKYIALIEHEKVHLEQQQNGVLIYLIKYILFPQFRYKQELVAYRTQIKYLKAHKIPVDIDKFAKILSSWIYLKCVSFKQAKQDLAST